MTFDDVGPPGSAESGNGVLDTIGIEDVGFVTGLNALGLAGVSHTDPDGGTHLPDAIGPGMACPGTPCGNPTDMQFVGQAISIPPVVVGGIDATVTIGRFYQNLGPAGFLGGLCPHHSCCQRAAP